LIIVFKADNQMVGIITGDIVASRRQKSPALWLNPLKTLFQSVGDEYTHWEIFRGDSFQLEIKNPRETLRFVFCIKALIKGISGLDVRMAIGIGTKNYSATRLAESSGSAFFNSGEKFESLKQEKLKLALKSSSPDFDNTFNLLLKFASITMDNWSVVSAKAVFIYLQYPDATQTELGQQLHIKQHTVSERLQRGRMAELVELDDLYRVKVQKLRS